MSLSGSPKTSCSALVLKDTHISNLLYHNKIQNKPMGEGRGQSTMESLPAGQLMHNTVNDSLSACKINTLTRNSFSVSCLPHVKETNARQSWILYSTPWIPVSRYQIFDSLSEELGFRIPIIGWIPDFLELNSQDSGLQRQKFAGYWNPQNLTWGDPWRQTFSPKGAVLQIISISHTCSYRRCHQTESKIETIIQNIKRNYELITHTAGQTFRRFI